MLFCCSRRRRRCRRHRAKLVCLWLEYNVRPVIGLLFGGSLLRVLRAVKLLRVGGGHFYSCTSIKPQCRALFLFPFLSFSFLNAFQSPLFLSLTSSLTSSLCALVYNMRYAYCNVFNVGVVDGRTDEGGREEDTHEQYS